MDIRYWLAALSIVGHRQNEWLTSVVLIADEHSSLGILWHSLAVHACKERIVLRGTDGVSMLGYVTCMVAGPRREKKMLGKTKERRGH